MAECERPCWTGVQVRRMAGQAPPGGCFCRRTGLTQTPRLETWFPNTASSAFPICSRSIILGTLTGGLQVKRKKQTSVCFLSSPNTFGSGIRMKNPYLVTFQVYSRRKTRRKGEKIYENKHKRHHLVSFLSLFALYLK